jgi:flagellar hook-associated protein 2
MASSTSSLVSIGGIGSGIDTKSLIAQLMQVESQPLVELRQKKAVEDSKNAAFQSVNTKLQLLQSTASDLTLDLNIKAKTASTTNANVVSATASSAAALGSYKIRVDQLASATSVSTNVAAGQPVTDPTQALTSLNTVSPVTAGNFTIQYNPGAGVQNATVAITAGMTLQQAMDAVSTATGGTITAALGSGANANKLVLTAAAGTTSLIVGSNSDTSNFASVMNLRTASYNTGTQTMVSSGGIGVSNPNVGIGSSNASGLSNAITTGGAGSFQINGVTITYNTGTDSIRNVLDRINASTAGVVATYNQANDRYTITSRSTGSGAITMSDTTGNFLQALGFTDPSRQQITNGQNALIGIEGINGFTASTGATDFTADLSSPTNDFSNVISGVTISAKTVSTGNTRETLNVTNDAAGIQAKVKAFVDAYNGAIDSITATTAKGMPDAFDNDLVNIQTRMQGLASFSIGGSSGYSALVNLGVSTTKQDRVHLSFDTTKFAAALTANPDAVAAVFQTSTTGVAQQFKTYLTGVSGASGIFATRNSSNTQAMRTYDQRIADMQVRLQLKQKTLQQQFTAMDSAVAKLHSQQNAFLSQLGSLG